MDQRASFSVSNDSFHSVVDGETPEEPTDVDVDPFPEACRRDNVLDNSDNTSNYTTAIETPNSHCDNSSNSTTELEDLSQSHLLPSLESFVYEDETIQDLQNTPKSEDKKNEIGEISPMVLVSSPREEQFHSVAVGGADDPFAVLRNYEKNDSGQRNLARISLYAKFDPLVLGFKSPQKRRHSIHTPRAPASGTTPENVHGKLLPFLETPHLAKEAKREPEKVVAIMTEEEFKELLIKQSLIYEEQLLQKDKDRAKLINGIKAADRHIERISKKIERIPKKERDIMDLLNAEYERTRLYLIDVYEGEKIKLENGLQTLKKSLQETYQEVCLVGSVMDDLEKKFQRNREICEKHRQEEESLLGTYTEIKQEVNVFNESIAKIKKETELTLQSYNNKYEELEKEYAITIPKAKLALQLTEAKVKNAEKKLEFEGSETVRLTQLCEDLLKRLGTK